MTAWAVTGTARQPESRLWGERANHIRVGLLTPVQLLVAARDHGNIRSRILAKDEEGDTVSTRCSPSAPVG